MPTHSCLRPLLAHHDEGVTDATHTAHHAPPAALEAKDTRTEFWSRCISMPRVSTLGPGAIGWRSPQTETSSLCGSSGASRMRSSTWPTGSRRVTSIPSRWSRPACIGSRFMKFWRHEASRCSSSMPGTSRTCPDARAMCPTASGSSGSIPLACCAAAFGPLRRLPPSVLCCVTETPSWRGRPPVSNGCRRR